MWERHREFLPDIDAQKKPRTPGRRCPPTGDLQSMSRSTMTTFLRASSELSANLKAIVGKGGVRPGEAEARPSIGLMDGRTDDGRLTDGRKNLDEKIWPRKNGGHGTGARHGRCGGKARVINGDSWGAKPPRPPLGGKARVTEIPGGASPPRPPHDTISKNLPFRGKFFEMI